MVRPSLSRITAAYLVVFLPIHFAIAFLEGAANGDWALTLHDFWYQLEAWVLLSGVAFLLLTIPSVALLAMAASRSQSLPPFYRAVVGIVVGPLSVIMGAALLSVVLRQSFAFLESLLAFPVALVVAGGILGYGSLRFTPNASSLAAA